MIKKILLNSTLLIVLLGLIGAPMASMALIKLEEGEESTVLSVQDERVEKDYEEKEEYIYNDIPEDLEQIIKRFEEELYQESIEATQEEESDILSP